MSGWRFEWVEGYDEVLAPQFIRRWDGLAARAPTARVFQEPLFARAWLESKGRALGVVPSFCWGSSDDGCEVLVPFCTATPSGRGRFYRRLIAVGEPHFDYQDPLALAPGDGSVRWDEFWPSLGQELARRRRSEQAMVLRMAASAPSGAPSDDANAALAIRLKGVETLNGFLEGRPRAHRIDVRRQIRRLEELGPSDLQVFAPDEAIAAREELGRFRDAYERLWVDLPSAGLLREPGTLAYHERLVDLALPTGHLHFSVQHVGGRPVSWHFGFLHRGVLSWHKPTYEKEFEAFSPGKVHLARLIEMGVRGGWTEIDLGGGDQPYKRRWTDLARPLFQWQWQADTWRGRLYRLARRAYHSVRGGGGAPVGGPAGADRERHD